jgi:hypothetical protein
MGVTVTPLEAPRAEGNRRKVRATVLFDSSYAPNKKIVMRWGDNNNAADAPGVQVADTTDLSAVTIRVEAQGY